MLRCAWGLAALTLLFPLTVLAQNQSAGAPMVIFEDRHDVSPQLRHIPPKAPELGEEHEHPVHPLPHAQQAPQFDPVVQSLQGVEIATSRGLNFDGVGTGFTGFTVDAAPPDTNGSVGATQFVEWVNESFAVFDKTTGAVIYGPAEGNTLWTGFGGHCETDNDGDPVVLYDKISNRWIMSQFAVTGGPPFLQCIAVSQTADATGAWNRYAFSFTQFNDYPKTGVWPDAYYMSFNMFSSATGPFQGGRVCAFDRNAMLAGTAATGVCFQLSTAFGGLLPSDLDGLRPPPAGSPNYFLSLGGDNQSLGLWKFHVDFVTPNNSTLSGPTNIAVAPFNPACSGGTCIPQPNTTQQLDSLGDRLMFRLAYRNLGSAESLTVNHSVATTVNGSATVGVRWYEVRNPTGTPLVWQQSTFAPDATYRWMGSMAQDQVGDMAMGYSASSSAVFPSVRYTGRLATDLPNSMGSENSIDAGTGGQIGVPPNKPLNRWGDYSSMSVDPLDDCTFWYANEYLKSSGTFNWSTRIASFRFPSCTSTTRINAGGPSLTDGNGNLWSADNSFNTGFTFSTSSNVTASTGDSRLYQTQRYNPTSNPDLRYSFSVPNGTYAVNLYFAELYFTQPGSRIFNVGVQSTTALQNFDVLAEAGGINKGLVKSTMASVSNGNLSIDFHPVVELPIINAIELIQTAVTPSTTGNITGRVTRSSDGTRVAGATVTYTDGSTNTSATTTTDANGDYQFTGLDAGTYSLVVAAVGLRNAAQSRSLLAGGSAIADFALLAGVPNSYALRIDAGGEGLTDGNGNVWMPDTGYNGGFSSITSASITASTGDPRLYQTLRYNPNSNLQYSFVDMPNGTYTLKLYFAETYFNTTGSRIFNVAVQGVTALQNLDVLAQAGGKNVGLVKTINAAVTNGTLAINFLPIVDLPIINAIEIVQTSSLQAVRVNVGGPSIADSNGNLWQADTGFNTGFTYSTSATITAPTGDPRLYQTLRYNPTSNPNLQYSFNVPNGFYTVNLYFAETYYTSSGSRVFNVGVQGVTAFQNLDVLAQAGGQNKGLVKSVNVSVTNGSLAVTFLPVVDLPIISAIEIIQTSTIPQVRVNAGGSSLIDANNDLWQADTGFNTGFTYSTSTTITAATGDPRLYQTLRYNPTSNPNLQYTFNLPNGSYNVNLYFAETYYTNEGSRIFNVSVQGATVLSNLDVLAQAGGANKGILKTATATVNSGTLSISFQPNVDLPIINAIEIVPTTP